VTVALLCAGAARGLLAAIGPAFTSETGAAIDATFGAVGALVEKLDAGAPCDAIVLTAALIERLGKEGRVVAGSALPLGRVPTGVAVPAGAPRPAIGDAAALRAALAAATRIVFPDPERATAGIHFAGVLQRLGLADEVAARCATFANGAAAMAALASSGDPGAIGCTQVTEILHAPGVALVGALPPGFELATVYSAAVAGGARAPDRARRLVAMLAGPSARAAREACGFEDER
jgi:molybdate transport system substrate-binding protein